MTGRLAAHLPADLDSIATHQCLHTALPHLTLTDPDWGTTKHIQLTKSIRLNSIAWAARS